MPAVRTSGTNLRGKNLKDEKRQTTQVGRPGRRNTCPAALAAASCSGFAGFPRRTLNKSVCPGAKKAACTRRRIRLSRFPKPGKSESGQALCQRPPPQLIVVNQLLRKCYWPAGVQRTQPPGTRLPLVARHLCLRDQELPAASRRKGAQISMAINICPGPAIPARRQIDCDFIAGGNGCRGKCRKHFRDTIVPADPQRALER